ncbi:energy transducer TonB [Novosphingobium sp. PP1Y]|uniref:energy transducer TonB n=1 Tax=Novosphingobium sp. PP1Y TaxID=702113 RepID=UPI0002E089F5|nr:energy transducer TonB [Novosphingobium sp. PP1Y]
MYAPRRERTFAALAAATIVAGGLAALVTGLAVSLPLPSLPAALEAVLPIRELPEKPKPRQTPSPSPTPAPDPAQADRGATSPPDYGAKASPVVAPQTLRPPLSEPPLIAAPKPDSGKAANEGASDRDGPGLGSGGSGTGSGDGFAGKGYGSGNGYRRPATLPRQVSGKLHFSELPRDLRQSREGAELTLRYRIGVDGHASQCRILVSSGRPELDAHTCRTITERFRFKPARDGMGNPVPFVMTEIHGWSDVTD